MCVFARIFDKIDRVIKAPHYNIDNNNDNTNDNDNDDDTMMTMTMSENNNDNDDDNDNNDYSSNNDNNNNDNNDNSNNDDDSKMMRITLTKTVKITITMMVAHWQHESEHRQAWCYDSSPWIFRPEHQEGEKATWFIISLWEHISYDVVNLALNLMRSSWWLYKIWRFKYSHSIVALCFE